MSLQSAYNLYFLQNIVGVIVSVWGRWDMQHSYGIQDTIHEYINWLENFKKASTWNIQTLTDSITEINFGRTECEYTNQTEIDQDKTSMAGLCGEFPDELNNY
jgi:hypothetical protein